MLVEAVICAILITVGLVAISRGFSGQLQAEKRLGEEDRMLGLARGVLAEQERQLWAGSAGTGTGWTRFDEPDKAYRWTMSAAALPETSADEVPIARVDAVVGREDGLGGEKTISMVWPAVRVPAEWF